jgi:hypothetical protein
MSVATYPAIIRDGKIEPLTPIELPEGSEVYIVVQPQLDLRTARKKATGWLVDQVGNLLMADEGILLQKDGEWLWRFQVYMTSLTHQPRGPIGQVDLNADTGEILNDASTIMQMYERGHHLLHPTPSAN